MKTPPVEDGEIAPEDHPYTHKVEMMSPNNGVSNNLSKLTAPISQDMVRNSQGTVRGTVQSIRQSDSGPIGRGSLAMSPEHMFRQSASPGIRTQYKNKDNSRSRSPGKKSKNSLNIHVSKIEKKVGDNMDLKKMERFSSQGQEELVQAYQLPTV